MNDLIGGGMLVSVMPASAHPKPPEQLGTCAQCLKWKSDQQMRVVQTSVGVLSVSELVKQGTKIPEGAVMNVAPCTNSPQWSSASDDHWCWQFKPVLS